VHEASPKWLRFPLLPLIFRRSYWKMRYVSWDSLFWNAPFSMILNTPWKIGREGALPRAR